jgi:hypothetical protein
MSKHDKAGLPKKSASKRNLASTKKAATSKKQHLLAKGVGFAAPAPGELAGVDDPGEPAANASSLIDALLRLQLALYQRSMQGMPWSAECRDESMETGNIIQLVYQRRVQINAKPAIDRSEAKADLETATAQVVGIIDVASAGDALQAVDRAQALVYGLLK